MTGTSHQKRGSGCEDVYGFRQLQNGNLLIAVADGAGSARQSAEGATCVVQSALHIAEDILIHQVQPENEKRWRILLRTVLQSARTILEGLASGEISLKSAGYDPDQPFEAENEEQWRVISDTLPNLFRTILLEVSSLDKTEQFDKAGERPVEVEASPQPTKVSLHEFATTLLFIIVTTEWIAVAQIGDGAVVIQGGDGELQALTWPDHGEYVNETSFVTDLDYLHSAQYCILARKEKVGIALFTDGLERLALDFATKTPYEPFFTPLFKYAASIDATDAELAAFLASERIGERTDDDKTLVLAVEA